MQKVSEITERSIKNKVITNSPSIESLPAKIDDLIDNKAFRNKFRSLVRRGYLPELLDLADHAASKDKPSHWYARATSKAMWDQTLAFLAKLRETARIVAEVVSKVSPSGAASSFVSYACWKLGEEASRIADTAKEIGRSRHRLFCHLAAREMRQ